jgi:hypothetical protein
MESYGRVEGSVRSVVSHGRVIDWMDVSSSQGRWKSEFWDSIQG